MFTRRVERSADGLFEDVVTQVPEDGLRMSRKDGQTIVVDAWAVCGDNTVRIVSPGAQIIVYADYEILSYDALHILDVNGEPICP